MFSQLFNRGLVTRSVTDKEEAESRLKRKEQDVETECGAAMQLQQQQNELRRGASLPGDTLIEFLSYFYPYFITADVLTASLLNCHC